jgi:uncharacterized membrane protein YecN with MAPEG domain
MPTITLLFAGILGLMSIAVAFPAGALRGKTGISIGDGGNPDLLLAMRRHANFAEFVPMALILMALIEMNGMSATAMYAFGGVLVVARICHAIGLKKDNAANVLRGIGAGGTALLTIVMSIWGIILVL